MANLITLRLSTLGAAFDAPGVEPGLDDPDPQYAGIEVSRILRDLADAIAEEGAGARAPGRIRRYALVDGNGNKVGEAVSS